MHLSFHSPLDPFGIFQLVHLDHFSAILNEPRRPGWSQAVQSAASSRLSFHPRILPQLFCSAASAVSLHHLCPQHPSLTHCELPHSGSIGKAINNHDTDPEHREWPHLSLPHPASPQLHYSTASGWAVRLSLSRAARRIFPFPDLFSSISVTAVVAYRHTI